MNDNPLEVHVKLNEYFDKAKGLGVFATSDESGKVNVAVYARPHFANEKDDRTVAFIMADHLNYANIQKNPHAAVALEDGTHPVILEGIAVLREEPSVRNELAPVFMSKYEWDFRTDDEADYHLLEFAPSKILSW